MRSSAVTTPTDSRMNDAENSQSLADILGRHGVRGTCRVRGQRFVSPKLTGPRDKIQSMRTVAGQLHTEGGTTMSSADTSVLTETCGQVSPAKLRKTVWLY